MRVLIGVTGGVAAYKVCEVTSTLAKAGVEVRVIMTAQAERFVSALTFAALSRHAVYTDQDFWSAQQGRPLHIELGEWAEVFVIAPLTANTLGKLACGLADNLLTNTVLASVCPILLAPAMNTDMWQQTVVQRNWQQLCVVPSHHTDNRLEQAIETSRYYAVGPETGRLACDRIGSGRMAAPQEIVSAVHSLLHTKGKKDLMGKHLLISTGSTQEYIDPVRFIGNPATGRMGIALALAAKHRGALVTLVHGPLTAELAQTIPSTVQCYPTITAADMEQTLLAHLTRADWVIMAAAVADVRPVTTASQKLPKSELPTALELTTVPDIVAQLAQKKSPHQRIIGFAAQTGDIVAPAAAKLQRKQLDAIVANPVDKAGSGFGSKTNEAMVLLASGQQISIANSSKLFMSHQLYDILLTIH
ncbi:MAG: bifunctional phosphopantothenoylcysteine decarboxylase/phosphopantothenate--cysteine ligase CoaBC [Cyanobacteria bacterium J06649_4]